MSQTSHEIVKFLKSKNKKISHLDLIQVKPLKENKIKDILKKYDLIFSIEENMPFGGISYLLSNLIVKYRLKSKLISYSLPEKYLFNSGPRDWMQKKYGLDKNKIIKEVLNHL